MTTGLLVESREPEAYLDVLAAWEDAYYLAAQAEKTEGELRGLLRRLCARYGVPELRLEMQAGTASDCLNAERIRICADRPNGLELCHEFAHALQWQLRARRLIHLPEGSEGHGASFVGVLVVLMEAVYFYDANRAKRAAEVAGLQCWQPFRVRELLELLKTTETSRFAAHRGREEGVGSDGESGGG